MSKAECNVVRDLMPLCIDGAASEESQGMVEGHLGECGECAQMYADMQDELVQRNAEKERKEMEAVAQRLRKQRLRRAMTAGVAGFLVAVLLPLLFAVYYADEIAFRVRYVHWNGDLKQEALFAKVSGDPNDEVKRYIHIDSFPSGSPHFTWKFESEILEDGTAWCLQIRAVYKGRDTEEYDAGGVLCYGWPENGVWTGYSGEEYGYLPIVRVELLSGNTSKVLWELGDEVQPQYVVSNEIHRLKEEAKEKEQN